MGVTPDRLRRVPTMFGKNGAVAPWIAAVAASSILYYRVAHLQTPAHPLLTAALRTAPTLVLHLLAQKLVELGSYERYGELVGRGLICCALGDVILAVEMTNSQEWILIFGLMCFALGHLFYASAFSLSVRRQDLALVYLVPIACCAMGYFVFLYPFLSTYQLLPVFVYIAVVTLMVATSLCQPALSQTFSYEWSRKSAMAGALIFVLSDCLLAITKVR